MGSRSGERGASALTDGAAPRGGTRAGKIYSDAEARMIVWSRRDRSGSRCRPRGDQGDRVRRRMHAAVFATRDGLRSEGTEDGSLVVTAIWASTALVAGRE